MSEDARVVARGKGGPANPNRVGFDATLAAVRDAARQTVAASGISMTKVTSLCAGLAGAGNLEFAEKMKRLLQEEFPGTAVRVCTDLDLVLAGMHEGATIVLIAGTGSAAMGRDGHGLTARVGGHGYLLGDEGSAYHVGHRAVKKALRSFERTGTDTLFGKRILKETRCANWTELQARINVAPDEVFPRLFPVVLRAVESGDAEARDLLNESAATLAELVKDLAERLKIDSQRFFLAKSGGMLGRSKYFDERLEQQLRGAVPFAEFVELTMSPAEAAANLALELAEHV